MAEYIGYKDPIGGGQFNMGLTDTEIIRCRDCMHFVTNGEDCLCNRFHVGYWDAEEEQDVLVRCVVNPDGFCSWAARREV